MVTDGTIEGTRLLSPFNVTNRGEPVNPPWFGLDELKEVGVFNDFFWFTIRDFELERYVLWSISKRTVAIFFIIIVLFMTFYCR